MAHQPFYFLMISPYTQGMMGRRQRRERDSGLPGVFHPTQIGRILLVLSETTRYMSDYRYGANNMRSGYQSKCSSMLCTNPPKQNVAEFLFLIFLLLTKKKSTILANLFCPHCVVHWQALSCLRAWTTDLLTTKTITTVKKIWVFTNF